MMHWYTQEGKEQYDATLREARKEGLLPGVTGILNIISSPGLTRYKENELIKAAFHCGIMPWDLFESSVKTLSMYKTKRAQKTGTAVHKMLERYANGKPLFYMGLNDEVKCAVELGIEWIETNVKKVYNTEYVFVGNGYAGKADLIAELVNGKKYIIDWKTTNPEGKLKKNGDPKKGFMFYNDHCSQLAALKMAQNEDIGVMNVILSTNRTYYTTFEKEWPEDAISTCWLRFLSAKTLWEIENDYICSA